MSTIGRVHFSGNQGVTQEMTLLPNNSTLGICASCPPHFRLCWARNPRRKISTRGHSMGLTKSKTIAAALSFGVPHTSIPVGKERSY